MSISKFIEKNQFFGNFTKTAIFGQVLFLLFLLRFGVPRCCFFKSMISQLSFAQKIIKKALLDQKLCQFEFLLWPIYLVIFNVITCYPLKKPVWSFLKFCSKLPSKTLSDFIFSKIHLKSYVKKNFNSKVTAVSE